ncbi:MAG: LysR family transcriptional regulator [Vulcanococcus sp.]
MRTWHKRREYGRLVVATSRRPHETVGATTAVPVLDAPFDDLTAFDLVAALGNTTDAARLLGISQSAVSRRYRQFASHYRIVPSEKVGRYCLTSLHSPLAELRPPPAASACCTVRCACTRPAARRCCRPSTTTSPWCCRRC